MYCGVLQSSVLGRLLLDLGYDRVLASGRPFPRAPESSAMRTTSWCSLGGILGGMRSRRQKSR